MDNEKYYNVLRKICIPFQTPHLFRYETNETSTLIVFEIRPSSNDLIDVVCVHLFLSSPKKVLNYPLTEDSGAIFTRDFGSLRNGRILNFFLHHRDYNVRTLSFRAGKIIDPEFHYFFRQIRRQNELLRDALERYYMRLSQ